MNKDKQQIISDLTGILGAEKVVTDAEVLKRESCDYVGYSNFERYRKQYLSNIPIGVVKPTSTQEVSDLLRYFNKNKINIVPKTGNSSATASVIPGDDKTVIVDASGMNEIVKFDEENMQVTAQCGVALEYLENYVNKRGYTTGHFPQSFPMAQMGGLVATRSTGQFSTLYGGIEELVMGLEAVLPNGEMIRIKDVPRRAAGPDIRHLFIGSEGALSFITEVTIKLFKYEPENRWMQAYAVDSMDIGLKILREIMVNGYKPAVARLHDAGEAEDRKSVV